MLRAGSAAVRGGAPALSGRAAVGFGSRDRYEPLPPPVSSGEPLSEVWAGRGGSPGAGEDVSSPRNVHRGRILSAKGLVKLSKLGSNEAI